MNTGSTGRFQPVKARENAGLETRLPRRRSAKSNVYDFYIQEETTIPSVWKVFLWNFLEKRPIRPTAVWTGVKAQLEPGEMIFLCSRSARPVRFGLIFANGVGIVDSASCDSGRDGNIGFSFYNLMPWDITLKAGSRVGQGLFKAKDPGF